MEDESQPEGGAKNAPQDVMFGHHVVTLIDVLGQQSKLADWDFLPETEYDKQKFITAVKGTFGVVAQLRTGFETTINVWLEAGEPPPWLAAMPDKGRLYREFAEMSIGFMHFSDTIVVYSPIVNQYGKVSARTVYSHLYTTATLMLSALAHKTVFRGAIEIGMAGQIDEAGIYGPVLASAHNLESKVAEYPRIMIGPRIVKYLKAMSADPRNSAQTRTNREIATRSLSMIGQDPTGHPILNYMGSGFTDLSTDQDAWLSLRDGASQFVTAERDRFGAAGDAKLAGRYESVVDYIKSSAQG